MALTITPPGDTPESRRVQRQARAGLLRRLYTGIYTDDLASPLEAVSRLEFYPLLAIVAPGALLSHRSALESGISPASEVFLTGDYRRVIKLPGLRVRIERGHGPLPDDIRIPTRLGPVFRSSEPRAFLENLQQSRGADASRRRTLGQAEVERRLEQILVRDGEPGLNRVRDRASEIAPSLGLAVEFARLDAIVGTLLRTRRQRLMHPTARARLRGVPYDPERVILFQALAAALEANPPAIPAAASSANAPLRAFIESYFSNYIEGTEFGLEEARAVVLENRDLPYREDDSHDIRGTFRAILESMSRHDVPADFATFRGLLQAWNREVIFSRAAKRPGEWKTERNFAGATEFVDPERVQGTLEKGFEILCAAGSVEARAALAMFLVAEVHPFVDGNGRTARLAMNHYLSSAGLTRIIVPTVYRDDYLTALKALTQSRTTDAAFPNAGPYIAMLTRAAAFSRWLDCSDASVLFDQLAASNALRRSFEAKLVFG